MEKVSKYTLARALRVYEIYEAHYQEGCHQRSARWVYLCRVRPVYAISESTYKRYLRIARHHLENNEKLEMRNSKLSLGGERNKEWQKLPFSFLISH